MGGHKVGKILYTAIYIYIYITLSSDRVYAPLRGTPHEAHILISTMPCFVGAAYVTIVQDGFLLKWHCGVSWVTAVPLSIV